MMRCIIVHIFFLFNVFVYAQDQTTLFNSGNDLYNRGDYQLAIDAYKKIENSGLHSFELYFNLANANYKLNNVAESIYYYEKALQLEPNSPDALSNLSFAQQMTIDAIDVVPDSAITRFFEGLVTIMSSDQWGLLSTVLAYCFIGLLLIYLFSNTPQKKRFSFVLSLFLLGFMMISLAFGFYARGIENNKVYAVIYSEEVQVKEEPNLRSSMTFKLHEGTKVRVLDSVGDWNKIKLTNGQLGWLQKESIKIL